jgi:hypothetical protein
MGGSGWCCPHFSKSIKRLLMVVLLQVFSCPRGVPVGVERWDCECECDGGCCWGSELPALLLRTGMASLCVVVVCMSE